MTCRLPQVLATPRLRLRAPVSADAAAIFRSYTQDPLVCRFLIWTPHRTVQQTEEFIQSCIKSRSTDDRLPYVIAEQESDVAIGMIEARVRGPTVDIGYVLARSHWNKGLMAEAIDSLSSAALGDPATFRVQATCDTENVSSQRALEKAGFRREGRLERYIVHPNISPEPRPCFMYAKCK